MKSNINEIRPAPTKFKVTLEFDADEFNLFCRMLKYTTVIPDALSRATSGSGWDLNDKLGLKMLLTALKRQFSKYIFPTNEEPRHKFFHEFPF